MGTTNATEEAITDAAINLHQLMPFGYLGKQVSVETLFNNPKILGKVEAYERHIRSAESKKPADEYVGTVSIEDTLKDFREKKSFTLGGLLLNMSECPCIGKSIFPLIAEELEHREEGFKTGYELMPAETKNAYDALKRVVLNPV